jgi:hypothetical protein
MLLPIAHIFKSYIMTHFRCYLLNATDNIVSMDSVEAETDDSAVELAGRLIVTKYDELAAIEVWDRARLIGKVLNPAPKGDIEPLLKLL